ncbi:MAG: hypothetical protein DMF91_17555 [Acidobacteria bacterium]|nr:MAG: hypothetical protein DMF91_17555 [Acidobacteriota bacterium]
MRAVLPVVLVLALVPATASAVTVQEIVSLTKAGVSEPVILALIERDKNIFTITPEQLVALQKEGLTDAVLLAMLRSGRQEPPLQQPASPLPPASAPQYDQYDQREPNVVVVGHGPDRPNAGDAYYYGAASYGVPYLVPVPYPVLVRAQRMHRGVRQIDVPLTPGLLTPNSIPPSRHDISASPATGIFFTTPARGIFFDR